MEEEIYHSGVHFKPKFSFYRGKRHTFLRFFEVAKKCDASAVVRVSLNFEYRWWMTVFLWYRLRESSLPIPSDTYSESLDRSRSFGPCGDHNTGQKIGKGNAKGGGKPGLEVSSWMIDFLLHLIRGPFCLYHVIHIRKAQTTSVPLVPELTILLVARLARVMPKEGG